MSKKTIFFILIYLFISITVLATDNTGSDVFPSSSQYSLVSDGEISYDFEQGIFHAAGNVRFESDSITITAGEVIVFYDENHVKAEGNPLIFEVGDKIYEGDALQYNYQDGTGSVSGVSTDIQDLSVSGENVLLTREETLRVNEAELTPCILSDPHYSMKARSITVFPEEKIVASGVWFYFSGHKVFYLPSYTVNYDETSRKYDKISFLTDIGYNSEEGIYLTLKYDYQYTDRFHGEIEGLINQYAEKDVKMQNYYIINDSLHLVNQYIYQEEKEDDGIIKETNQLSGGIDYSYNDLDISAILKHDYIKDNNILEIDSQYSPGPYKFSFFRRYTEKEQKNEVYSEIDLQYNPALYKLSFFRAYDEEELTKEFYNIRYNGSYPVQLQYKKGYDIDYLPYLRIEKLNYNYADFSLRSSIGLGKVAEGNISTDKLALNLNIDQKLISNYNFKMNIHGQMKGNYYFPEDSTDLDENYYNHYLIGINSQGISTFSDRFNIDYELAYDYSWETGSAYLPEDRIDIEETIRPSITLNYKLDEYHSYMRFNVQGKYDLREENIKEMNLRLTREFDCYSYFIGYDVINEGYELGLYFDI